MTPLRSIKEYCIDCSGGMKNEVRLCPITNCPLYNYRTGHGQGRVKRNLSDEQRKAIGIRLQSRRLKKDEPQ